MQNLSQYDLDQITKMLGFSQNELEEITKMRRIKNYNNMSKEDLSVALLKSNQSLVELQKSKSNNAKIEETRKIFNELKNRFLKKGIKEIRKTFYEKEKIDKQFKELKRENILKNEEKKVKKYQEEQEKKQYLKESEKKNALKKTEKFFKNLRKYLGTIKKHHSHNSDDPDYEGIRSIEDLFNKIDEVYYKPVKTKRAFNDNYIKYESRGDKDKKLSPEEYLDMIKPYLRDMINNHRDSSGNDNYGDCKIQLTMQISFISSLDTGEIRTMYLKSKSIEILMGNETDDFINELFKSVKQAYEEGLEKKCGKPSLFLKALIYCIIAFIKQD